MNAPVFIGVTTGTNTPWIKASKSGSNGGDCVEMRGRSELVEVRDTKAQDEGPTLGFTKAEFAAWLDGASVGNLIA